MTTQDPFRDDERPESQDEALRALFDATAEEPSPEALNRLARTAAQIPERHATSPLRAWLRRLAPALGLAAAAAAGWFLLASPDDGGEGVDGPSSTATVAMSSPGPEPAPPEPPAAVPWVDEEQEELALAVLDGETEDERDEDLGGELDDPVASLGMEPVDGHPMDALAVLFPPEDDEEAYAIYSDALGALFDDVDDEEDG